MKKVFKVILQIITLIFIIILNNPTEKDFSIWAQKELKDGEIRNLGKQLIVDGQYDSVDSKKNYYLFTTLVGRAYAPMHDEVHFKVIGF